MPPTSRCYGELLRWQLRSTLRPMGGKEQDGGRAGTRLAAAVVGAGSVEEEDRQLHKPV